MTFEQLKGLALGSITVEELSQGLIQKIGEVSKAEATTIVEGVKTILEQAIADGDDALDAKIQAIEESLSTGDIHLAIEGLKGQVSGIDGRLGTVEQNHTDLKGEVDALKSTVGGKNNATQVFADMEEFEAYSIAKKEEGSLIKGDMAYVISVKKSYIYNPDAMVAKLDNPTPPEGWMFFDEISTDLDLADYAKKVHTHEMSEVNGLDAALATKLEASDLATLEGQVSVLEGKVDVAKVSEAITAAVNPVDVIARANEAAITTLNAGEDQAGSVDYKIKQVKDALDAVDAGLRTDVDKAKQDILTNAAEIAKLTAKNYILTRKQELVDAVDAQTTYELTAASVSENFIADVFVNSVRLVEGEGKDYTLVGKTLTLTKARSTGSVIQVLYTFISDANQA